MGKGAEAMRPITHVYGETAAQLGVHFNMPAATVRTRLHRARLALQKLLKEG